jgi:hypothetical protein
MYDTPSHDRGYSTRDYHHSSRDEYSRHPSSRDDRYGDTPPAPPPPARDHRRALTQAPRDRRDDPPPRREYDDHRMQSSPPPPPVSVPRHDRTRHHGSERDYPSSVAPPDRESYDRYDRRPPHSEDRSAPYPAHGGRPRTPPGPPPSWRDDHDKAPR